MLHEVGLLVEAHGESVIFLTTSWTRRMTSLHVLRLCFPRLHQRRRECEVQQDRLDLV